MDVDLDPDGTSTGTVGGVISAESLIQELYKASGAIDDRLCDRDTQRALFELIRESADSLADGSQEPDRICDAISIGLDFDAYQVVRPVEHGEIARRGNPYKPACD